MMEEVAVVAAVAAVTAVAAGPMVETVEQEMVVTEMVEREKKKEMISSDPSMLVELIPDRKLVELRELIWDRKLAELKEMRTVPILAQNMMKEKGGILKRNNQKEKKKKKKIMLI